MKRLVLILVVFIVMYATYYDLTTGTLPKSSTAAPSPAPVETVEPENMVVSQEVIVESGYTVLSIVEHLNEGPIPSIQQVVDDFSQLNPGIHADQIKVGHTYLFPLYGVER